MAVPFANRGQGQCTVSWPVVARESGGLIHIESHKVQLSSISALATFSGPPAVGITSNRSPVLYTTYSACTNNLTVHATKATIRLKPPTVTASLVGYLDLARGAGSLVLLLRIRPVPSLEERFITITSHIQCSAYSGKQNLEDRRRTRRGP